MRLLLFLLILSFLSCDVVRLSHAIWLSIPPSSTKCVSEEIQNNVVALGEYLVVPDDHAQFSPTISSKVVSPHGNSLHHKENTTEGHFGFTTHEAGNYLVCLWADSRNKGSGDVSVNLEWRIGIAAKDWDSVAKKEKLEGLELELRKLEEAVGDIHQNIIHLKDREANMRIVNEKTNARVAWFSIMSLALCIAASVLQIMYLKRFFQKKKLI